MFELCAMLCFGGGGMNPSQLALRKELKLSQVKKLGASNQQILIPATLAANQLGGARRRMTKKTCGSSPWLASPPPVSPYGCPMLDLPLRRGKRYLRH